MADRRSKELGKRIKEAREKLNMSQFHLQQKTHISTTQISAYENGKKSLGLQSLAKIALALGLSMDELYYGPTSNKPISTAADAGELIVNCVFALYEQGVICSLPHEKPNGYVGAGAEHYYRIGFMAYVGILDDLITKLKAFERDKDNYPDPEGFKKQLLAAAAKQINKVIKLPPIL